MSGELERFDPAEQRGRIAYEHLHRYALCAQHVAGKRVLDLACGTGYGTAILGAQGGQVTGVDISAAAIRIAKLRHGSDNTTFVIADCFDLPFAAASFDVVVANEMIEHVADHDALIIEARRVLAPGGLLLVSTPNKPVYNRFKSPNTFHVSEMDQPEFQQLVGRHFRHVRLTGTRMALLSVGFPLDDSPHDNLGAARIFNGSVTATGQPELVCGEFGLAEPEYLIAACSDEPLETLPVESSLYLGRNDDLWQEHERIMAWASQLHEEDELLRADVMRLHDELARDRAQLADLRAEHQRLNQQAADLRQGNGALAQAMERERDGLGREADNRRSMLARLLGQASGEQVAADDIDIIAGLFSLNQQLLTARLRGEMAEEKAAQADARSAELAERLATMERELSISIDAMARSRAELFELISDSAATAAEREQLAAELIRVQQQLASSERGHEQKRAELAHAQSDIDRLALELAANTQAVSEKEAKLASAIAELTSARAELVDTRAALGSTQAELTATKTEFDATQAELTTTKTELGAAQAELGEAWTELASERRELASARNEVERLHKAVAAQAPPPAVARRRERLALVHQQVAADLASAVTRVAGRIGSPPPPPPRRWQQQLLGRPAPLPTRIFDAEWVKRQRPGLTRVSLAAYLGNPALHDVDPHPLFAARAYLAANPDVAAEAMAPLAHYVLHGWREGRNPHPLFPGDWYLAQNPDVAADGGINPLDHYLQHGWREGRWPNPLFDPRAYLDRYPDVAAADVDPFTHFIAHGQHEGREPQFRGWDPDWAGLLGAQASSISVLHHLLNAPPPAPPAAAASSDAAAWPPKPVDDYWPAQKLRDFLLDGYGEAVLNRSWYLLSLMQRWQDRQSEFAASDDCRTLLERLRHRAALRTLPAEHSPDASVIIPVYNNVLDTLICLASLLELEEVHDFEVIVADDGSSDATAALVGAIGGCVRHLRQPQNLGFLGNCNAAAMQAIGRHIILLNNDTLVFPGWLDGLLTPFGQFDRVGLVGSKLINWDGTLQEAGGIFWRDGSAWNFGRNQDARAPEYNYLKDVDYVSGASIAVPASVWRDMAGFDPAYTPAYCEDSDLAFRLREAGYRTLYSPASEVMHHEGRSHGRDVASGIKAYQTANSQRLFDRWRHVLERDHYPNAQNVLRARDRSFAKRHVLVVDHYVPQWDRDAGSRTVYEFMRVLLEAGHAVTFWPDNLWRDPEYAPKLQALGVEVIHGVRFRDGFDGFMAERADLYDMVLLSRPHVAVHYVDAIRRHSKAHIIYYGHDVHFRRMMAQRTLEGRSAEDAEVAAMRTQELGIAKLSDLVLYPSQDEATLIAGLLDGRTQVRAIAAYRFKAEELAVARAALLQRAPATGPIRLLFVGGFAHPPNVDAITWFCREVLPKAQAAGRELALTIVGSKAGAEVKALERTGVSVRGFVSDEELLHLYTETDMVIAPLRYGAGVKGKVIEAMARGVPVVTTEVGAQGIDGADQMLFIADTADTLAAAVIAATDHEAARQRARASLDFIDQHYSTKAMLSVLEAGLAPD
ncbi:methyltransferase domain-containing protein [Sandarakinorhabdus sp.]|uniref:methyltransferase domain-containing protein n=1 Tax=Sandarakinorhabdus sp. TaxID=1916663 RepID=UPI00286DDC71|nr:methyltransferase domain-containing protein [Sandarakinorhabdus sp.]